MVNNKITEAEENLLHVYNRFPIVLDHGEDVYLYDAEGKKYLDFAAGIAVCGLGYSNKELKDALKKQIDLLCHTSNLYFHESCGEAAKKLNEISEMDRVFFTNSGTEAIEGALKSARKYAYTKESGRYEIIAMQILSDVQCLLEPVAVLILQCSREFFHKVRHSLPLLFQQEAQIVAISDEVI